VEEQRKRRFARPAEEGSAGAVPSTATESPQTAIADGESKPTEATEAEIMTRLPHTRPERRSSRRSGATGQRRRTTKARAAGSRKRAATAKKSASTTKSDRGLRQQITDLTIQTATLPIRTTFALARRAGRLTERLR
jgi:hypothetical protein